MTPDRPSDLASPRGDGVRIFAKAGRILLWAAATALFVVLFGILWFTWDTKAVSPLTENLPSGWDEGSATFASRLVRQFPLGTPEEAMGEALSRQGFVPVDWGGVTGGEHRAIRDESDLVCVIHATVTWRSDARRRIVAIGGERREHGCL